MEERLKKFAVLVDYGTFTEAARQLHISQPALTTAIKKLERELKSSLLVHTSGGFVLTKFGQLAYDQGNQLNHSMTNFRNRFKEAGTQRMQFRLGCIDSVADLIVKRHLIKDLNESTELSLNVESSSTLMTRLKRQQIDLVLAVKQPAVSTSFAVQTIGREQFYLACSPSLKTNVETEIKQGRLTRFLAYNIQSTTYNLLSQQLLAQSIVASPSFYSTNPAILLEVALQGKGVVALPRSMITTELKSKLVEIHLKTPLFRPISAYWQNGIQLPPETDRLLGLLTKAFD
ncbi:MAG: LysR family transcriptional regulator [Candidatus Saccharimonadales bacterium]